MITAKDALKRLKDGNKRFVASLGRRELMRRMELTHRQRPLAIVLSCSDARVPAELVFDQGLGDLFVIRVAGNIVAPSQVGSVEFAAEAFGTKLVVVMGHTNCGAIMATLNQIRRPPAKQSPNLRSIVERVRPSVETVFKNAGKMKARDLIRQCVLANVKVSVDHLRHGSEILERLIRKSGVKVVGAKYSIYTGAVEFLDF